MFRKHEIQRSPEELAAFRLQLTNTLTVGVRDVLENVTGPFDLVKKRKPIKNLKRSFEQLGRASRLRYGEAYIAAESFENYLMNTLRDRTAIPGTASKTITQLTKDSADRHVEQIIQETAKDLASEQSTTTPNDHLPALARAKQVGVMMVGILSEIGSQSDMLERFDGLVQSIVARRAQIDQPEVQTEIPVPVAVRRTRRTRLNPHSRLR